MKRKASLYAIRLHLKASVSLHECDDKQPEDRFAANQQRRISISGNANLRIDRTAESPSPAKRDGDSGGISLDIPAVRHPHGSCCGLQLKVQVVRKTHWNDDSV